MEELSQKQRDVLDNYGFHVDYERTSYKSWRSPKHPTINVWYGKLTNKLRVDFETSSEIDTANYQQKEFEFYIQLRKELKVKTDVKR